MIRVAHLSQTTLRELAFRAVIKGHRMRWSWHANQELGR